MSALLSLGLVLALSSQPELEDPTAEARASVRGRSRTFVLVGGQTHYELAPGAPRLVEHREIPVVQDFFLDAKPGVEGLSIALDASIVIDAGDRLFEQRVFGDITEGYLEWKTRPLTFRAGRLFFPSFAGRSERFDGGSLALHPRIALGGVRPTVQLFGGVPVAPRHGDEVLLGVSPELARDPLALAMGGTDWDRPGDWTAGAIVGLDWERRVELGVGYVRKNDLAEVDREAALARLMINPLPALTLTAHGAFDLYAEAIEDARAAAELWIGRDARVEVYARTSDPSLLLPSTSLFSVFATERHSELGVEADVWVGGKVRLYAAAEARRTDVAGSVEESANGHRLSAAVHTAMPFWRGSRVVFSWERLADGWYGAYDYARAGGQVPVVGWWSLAADGGVFVIQPSEVSDLGGTQRAALRAGLAAIFQDAQDWRAAIALRATHDPDTKTDVAVIARIEWNAERTF